MANEVEAKSQSILEYLTKGLNFDVPDVDFSDETFNIPSDLLNALKEAPTRLTEGELTARRVDGSGVFDGIMASFKAHLKEEYEAGRITGAEYTKAYTAMITAALQNAVQFLVQRDQAYFNALAAHIGAFKGVTDLYTAKVQLAIAKAQALGAKAQYANQVLQLAAAEQQVFNLQAQEKLVKEQTAQARAQTRDTLEDGTAVSGYTGNQNKLLKQQVVSFQQDAVVKGAKVYADSFSTQLSMSAATVSGTGLDANSIGTAMAKLQKSMDRTS